MDEQQRPDSTPGALTPIQHMEPAPWLPAPAESRGTAPAAAGSDPESADVAAWQALLRQHSEAHQLIVAHQSLAHAAFLEHRARALDLLLQVPADGDAAPEPPLLDPAEVSWDPHAAAPPAASDPFEPAKAHCTKTAFTRAELEAFASGRIFPCFGPGFELAQTHTRSARPLSPLLLEAVTHFAPAGGPWGRGHLRAVLRAGERPEWLLEACRQALAFHLTALGFSLDRDGWQFAPFVEREGASSSAEILPGTREVALELFVREVHGGETPTVVADVLCSADGRRVFHAEGLGCRLVADFPLTSHPELLANARDPGPVAQGGGISFGHAAILASAWGKPSDAMGEKFRIFDGARRAARLPGPPFLFITRVLEVTGEMGVPKAGASAVVEYDFPADAWYFSENGTPKMPFAVLLEAALQPCGWLAGYIGCALDVPHDIFYRNLDGSGTVLAELPPGGGPLRTAIKLTRFSKSAGIYILGYDITCSVGGVDVYRLESVFGFFPKEALEAQAGLPTTPEQDEWFQKPSDFQVDLRTRPAKYVGGAPHLPGPMLLMLDRVTGFWPTAGRAGLGRLRAEKDVDPGEWFFKAHFFQDPVQPGSLGLEALIQLLQFHVIESGLAEGIPNPRFEPIALGVAHKWKYRGQVRPHHRVITTEAEITKVERDAKGVLVTADVSLRVDGRKVYEAQNLGVRVVAGEAPKQELVREFVIDPKDNAWVHDHCPTYTVPVFPMMNTIDLIAQAAHRAGGGRKVVRIEDVQLRRWAPATGPARFRTTVTPGADRDVVEVKVELWREAKRAALSRFEELTTARVRLADEWPAEPARLPPLENAVEDETPYASGHMFHGPAFQVVKQFWMGTAGSTARLDASTRLVPFGLLQPALLDGTTHGIPHDRLETWSPEIAPRQISFPSKIPWMSFHSPTPASGDVRLETRFEGFDGPTRAPVFRMQAFAGERMWLEYRLVAVTFPQGPLVARHAPDRRRFLLDQVPMPGLSLSTFEGGVTRTTQQAFAESDWLAGSVATAYRLATDKPLEEVAVKDHVARLTGGHPAWVAYHPESGTATCENRPLTRFPVEVRRESSTVVTVRDAGPAAVELGEALPYLRGLVGNTSPRSEALFTQLARHFVSRIELADPLAMRKLRGRSALYLANHQTQIESILFSTLMTGAQELPVVVLANAKHRDRWVGRLVRFAFEGARDLDLVRYFDQNRPETLPGIIDELADELKAGRRSFMVHVEGTRQTSCRDEVTKISSLFPDLAIRAGIPIVPVRFTRGPPVAPLTEGKLEVPVGYGGQEYLLGSPITPEELESLPLARRRERVLGAINALGTPAAQEEPSAPRPELAAEVERRMRETGVAQMPALFSALLGEPAADWAEWGFPP